MKIGFFDSGVGGLTLVSELLKIENNLSFYYVGDNEHCPYGNKSESEIKERIERIIKFLLKNDCEIIIIACNTASIIAEKYNLLNENVIGISQLIKNEINKIDNFVIYGTKSTIKSNFYKISKKKMKQISSKKLAKLIETETDLENNIKIVREIKRDIKNIEKKMNKLVLCCTHYPIVKNLISKVFQGEIIDYNPIIANKILKIILTFKEKIILKEKKIYFTKSKSVYDSLFIRQIMVEAQLLKL
ncbi:MAG: aspartate/glutamate racemase family protein [Bacilli bacterium]